MYMRPSVLFPALSKKKKKGYAFFKWVEPMTVTRTANGQLFLGSILALDWNICAVYKKIFMVNLGTNFNLAGYLQVCLKYFPSHKIANGTLEF